MGSIRVGQTVGWNPAWLEEHGLGEAEEHRAELGIVLAVQRVRGELFVAVVLRGQRHIVRWPAAALLSRPTHLRCLGETIGDALDLRALHLHPLTNRVQTFALVSWLALQQADQPQRRPRAPRSPRGGIAGSRQVELFASGV